MYKSPFTDEIYIDSKSKAFIVLTHFCDYCKKDAIGRFHCPYADVKRCEITKDEIRNDWFKRTVNKNEM